MLKFASGAGGAMQARFGETVSPHRAPASEASTNMSTEMGQVFTSQTEAWWRQDAPSIELDIVQSRQRELDTK